MSSDDIVTRLRNQRDEDGYCVICGDGKWQSHFPNCTQCEAADEIERLRAAGDALYELISVRLVIPADQHDDAVEQIRKWKEARRD